MVPTALRGSDAKHAGGPAKAPWVLCRAAASRKESIETTAITVDLDRYDTSRHGTDGRTLK